MMASRDAAIRELQAEKDTLSAEEKVLRAQFAALKQDVEATQSQRTAQGTPLVREEISISP